MRARYYEVGSGRFISQDGSRQGSNWFEYSYNVPTLGADASGKGVIGICTFLFGFLLALGLCSLGHFIDDGVFKLTATDLTMSLLGGAIAALTVVTKLLTKGDEAADAAIEGAEKECLEIPLEEMASPEETVAEDSCAGPAVDALMFDIGMIEGELFMDQIDGS